MIFWPFPRSDGQGRHVPGEIAPHLLRYRPSGQAAHGRQGRDPLDALKLWSGHLSHEPDSLPLHLERNEPGSNDPQLAQTSGRVATGFQLPIAQT